MDVLNEVREVVVCRIFSHNKAIGKSEWEPKFIDEEETLRVAMNHLIDKLADIALEETEVG